MKKLISLAFLTVIFGSGLAVETSAQTSLKYAGHIPFEFRANNVTFPAGDYLIAAGTGVVDSKILIITNAKTREHRYLGPLFPGPDNTHAAATLVFVSAGNQWYLADVSTPTFAKRFTRSKTDASTVAQKQPPSRTVTIERQN